MGTRGINHYMAKRNGRSEAEIKAILADPRPYPAIARDYQMSKPMVCKIKTGKAWRSVSKNVCENGLHLLDEQERVGGETDGKSKGLS